MINHTTWIVQTQWIPCAIGMEYLCLFKPYHLSPFYLTSIINLCCCETNGNITWRHRKKNSIITTPPILFMTNFRTSNCISIYPISLREGYLYLSPLFTPWYPTSIRNHCRNKCLRKYHMDHQLKTINKDKPTLLVYVSLMANQIICMVW